LKGQQDILEREYPDLAEKGKKYLGFDMYYSLSTENPDELKQPLKEGDSFKKMLDISEHLNKSLDEQLEKMKQASLKKRSKKKA